MRPRLAWTLLALALCACAKAASVGGMTAAKASGAGGPADPALKGAVCVETVRGGKKTNPLWASEVDNDSFLRALEQSLANHGLLAQPGACHYGVEAHLLGLSQPFIDVDVEVTASVNYRVRKPGMAEPYLLKTAQASYVAQFTSDKVLFGTRLKAANEGAVRKNIRAFIDDLLRRPPPA